jgi:hypothetical protein
MPSSSVYSAVVDGITAKRPSGSLMPFKNREEVPLNSNKWVRQTHRWLSMVFTAGVIVNIAAVVQGKYTNRVGLLAVLPLALQFFTGLYLLVLPHAIKWRSARHTD